MAKKKPEKIPLLPLRIRQRANGSYYDSYSGVTLSDKEIDAYREDKAVKQDHKLSHDQIIEKRWDLRID